MWYNDVHSVAPLMRGGVSVTSINRSTLGIWTKRQNKPSRGGFKSTTNVSSTWVLVGYTEVQIDQFDKKKAPFLRRKLLCQPDVFLNIRKFCWKLCASWKLSIYGKQGVSIFASGEVVGILDPLLSLLIFNIFEDLK